MVPRYKLQRIGRTYSIVTETGQIVEGGFFHRSSAEEALAAWQARRILGTTLATAEQEDDGTWSVVNRVDGRTVAGGLSQRDAVRQQRRLDRELRGLRDVLEETL
jgi:hypothetical protein